MFSCTEFSTWPRGPHTTHKVEPQEQTLAELDILSSVWGANSFVSTVMLSGLRQKADTGMLFHWAETMLFRWITVQSFNNVWYTSPLLIFEHVHLVSPICTWKWHHYSVQIKPSIPAKANMCWEACLSVTHVLLLTVLTHENEATCNSFL